MLHTISCIVRIMKLLIAQLKTKRPFIKYGPLRAMFIPDNGGSTHLWNVGRQLFYIPEDNSEQ
jgi:hypothetical protein